MPAPSNLAHLPRRSPNLRQKITQRTLAKLHPRQREWYIKDTELRGFQIRVNPQGPAVYRVEARLGGTGRVIKRNLGDVTNYTARQAREKAQDWIRQIRAGMDPREVERAHERSNVTLGQLTDEYTEIKNLKSRTAASYKYRINKYLSNFTRKRITEITRQQTVDWYRQRRDIPTTTDTVYRNVSSIMNYAVGLGLITENPFNAITQSRIRYRSNQRSDYIDLNDDLEKFGKALLEFKPIKKSEAVARDIILFILTTGVRKLEAMTLKWSDIDWEKKVICFKNTKNNQDHYVPMTLTHYAMLRRRQDIAGTNPYVFPDATGKGRMKDFRKTLHNICKAAGVKRYTPHDLRRTFATILNEIGVGHFDTKALLNHRSKDVTQQYVQQNREKLRSILTKAFYYIEEKIPSLKIGGDKHLSSRHTLIFRYFIYDYGEPCPALHSQQEQQDPTIWDERNPLPAA